MSDRNIALFGFVHTCLLLYVLLWSGMALYGISLVCLVLFGLVWSCMVLNGWSCVVLYCPLWSCKVWSADVLHILLWACMYILVFSSMVTPIVDGWLSKEVKEENNNGIEEFGKDLMEGGI